MITIQTVVKPTDCGTAIFHIAVTSSGTAVTPSQTKWQLSKTDGKTIINDRSFAKSALESDNIVLRGDDLNVDGATNGKRILAVAVEYVGPDDIKVQENVELEFSITNLVSNFPDFAVDTTDEVIDELTESTELTEDTEMTG